MANYKIVDTEQLEADLTSVADSIRAKAGTSGTMAFPDGFKSAVEGIEKGGTLQAKTVTPTTERQTVTADSGYYGLSSVTVEAAEAGGGSMFVSTASGRIPDYDHGYATSTLALAIFTSSAVGALA